MHLRKVTCDADAALAAASRGGIHEERARAGPRAAASAMDAAENVQRNLALLQQQRDFWVA
jgi:hypothetical protein